MGPMGPAGHCEDWKFILNIRECSRSVSTQKGEGIAVGFCGNHVASTSVERVLDLGCVVLWTERTGLGCGLSEWLVAGPCLLWGPALGMC